MIAGDERRLARKLGVEEQAVIDWLLNDRPLPTRVFLKCVDLVIAEHSRHVADIRLFLDEVRARHPFLSAGGPPGKSAPPLALKDQYRVRVPKDVMDLIPTFLQNRNAECAELYAALKAFDADVIRQYASTMKAVGIAYGFDRISELGVEVEEALRLHDLTRLERLAAEYRRYLDGVQVEEE